MYYLREDQELGLATRLLRAGLEDALARVILDGANILYVLGQTDAALRTPADEGGRKLSDGTAYVVPDRHALPVLRNAYACGLNKHVLPIMLTCLNDAYRFGREDFERHAGLHHHEPLDLRMIRLLDAPAVKQ